MLRASSETDAPYQRTSVLFGDATFIDNLKPSDKSRLELQVTFPKFWFLFRYTLPVTAPLLFITTFLWPYFFVNKTDGYLFCGAVLSVVFCSLSVLSYYHVKPWQRHPSPLIMQICLMSLFTSLIFLVNTVPFGRVDALTDGGDINVVDNGHYNSHRDNTIACLSMSLLLQLALLAREAWILTLSIDLLTSITNPFASYTSSQRKYHVFVWLTALAGAIILINHKGCQGRFLSNGTCWIRIDGIASTCLWGYFLCWMIIFYVNAAAVLAYAFSRISKGLESTYATRYACVADTFRVVLFYFLYGLLLAGLLLLLYYAIDGSSPEADTLFMQHLVAYCVACRGFFDALVWFFTHGFVCSRDTVTNFALMARPPLSNKKLTMQDIMRPKFFMETVFKSLRLSSSGTDSTLRMYENDQLTSLLVDSDGVASPSRHSTHLPFQGERSSSSEGADIEADDASTPPRPLAQPSFASASGSASTHVPLLSDIDVSPQLNLALRREVVELVTMGIRVSVQRMQEREGATQTPERPERRGPTPSDGGSFSTSTRSVMTKCTDEVFHQVRLSSSQHDGMDLPGQTLGPSRASAVYIAPQPNIAQSFYYSKSSSRFSTAMHSLLSTMGTVLPGEYGVDRAAYDVSQQLQFNHMASFGEEKVSDPTSSSASPTPQLPPPPPAEVVFTLLDKHTFRDFRPATFRKLRRIAGLSEEQYLDIISQPTRERLSEGGSGAFFFVCGDGDFIVKTVERSEATTLLSVLDKYYQHLAEKRESFLVRFLGLHEICMYGNYFTFVIMKNVFPPGIKLNERYDLKGSWVNRNASLRAPGKQATCRHCHEPFIDGTSERCPVVVGEHEASVTLKDNDMICKIRLYPHHSYEVIDTLYSDSDALCEMGLTDYSLLVGVQHARYDVEALLNSQISPGGYFEPPIPEGSPGRGAAEEKHALGSAAYLQKYPARIVIAPQDYYFGVIDILQTWSLSKKLERWFKVTVLGQDRAGVSCMCPEDFKVRFQRKIAQIVEHAVFAREVTGSWQGKRYVDVAFHVLYCCLRCLQGCRQAVYPGFLTKRHGICSSMLRQTVAVFHFPHLFDTYIKAAILVISTELIDKCNIFAVRLVTM